MSYWGWVKAHRRWVIAFFMIGIPTVFLFQNCGKAGFEASETEDFIGTISQQSTGTTNFAFDMSLDQIAYNSCSGSHVNSNTAGFFTLKAGAYRYGGAKLSASYVNSARNELKPEYPATSVTNTQLKRYLASSNVSMGSVPQLAVRQKQNLQTIYSFDGAPAIGYDYVNMLGDLTDDRWLDTMMKSFDVNPNTGVSFYPLAPGGQRIYEGMLTMNKDEGVAASFREIFGSTGHLAITYKSIGGEQYAARAPTSDPSRVFGRGYIINFQYNNAYYNRALHPSTVPWANSLNNTISNIQEIQDLNQPTVVTNNAWDCSPDRQYMIVQNRASGWGDLECPTESYDEVMNDANLRRELEIVRRSLKPEDWDVNIRLRCVVPKKASCYKDERSAGNILPIEYDWSKPCFDPTIPSSLYGGNIPTNRCAQYISICLRK